MVTTIRSGINTYPTSVSGGTNPADTLIIDVSQWAEALEPRRTPLLTDIGIGEALEQRPFYWGQSSRVAVETTTGATHTNNIATLTVASGSGPILQKYMVLELTNFIAGSTTILDETRREIVIVTGEPTGDTAAIARGQSGTTGIAHDLGCRVLVIGVAEPELQFHTIAPHVRGTRLFNYFQRFEGGVKADKAAQNMPTWEHRSNPMLADFEEEQLKQKYLLEMAIWRGGRQAGDPTTPLGATMGGLDTFITTNVTNVGQAKLTPRVLEAELRDLAKSVEGGPDGIRLLMSYDTAAIFDTLIDPIRMAGPNDTKITVYTESIRFRFGTFDIGISHNARNGVIYGIRTRNLKVHPFKGMNWHMSEKKGEQHGADHDEKYISADMTLVVQREKELFKLWNFDQDMDNYTNVWAA